MCCVVERKDFQKLARLRVREAKALLDRGLFDGAYYLAGYAVECALKACIAKKTKKHEFPDKKAVERSYTHDLNRLIEAAGLSGELQKRMDSDDRFALNWRVVVSWSEDTRYLMGLAWKAKALHEAITDKEHGVLQWLRGFW